MKYEDFVHQRKHYPDFTTLTDDVSYYLVYGDIGKFPDKGWPRYFDKEEGRFLVLAGAQINHRTQNGGTCGGYIAFVHSKSPSESEAKTPLWRVESLQPLTLSPSIQCYCWKMHGCITNGQWVRSEESLW